MENLQFFELLGFYYKEKKEYKIAFDFFMKIPDFEDKEILSELGELVEDNTLLSFDDTELELPKNFKNSLKPLLGGIFEEDKEECN